MTSNYKGDDYDKYFIKNTNLQFISILQYTHNNRSCVRSTADVYKIWAQHSMSLCDSGKQSI